MGGAIHIGVSGWSYDEWKDDFYRHIPRSSWLEHYARHFACLEINGTFYRLQSPRTLSSWASRTPEDFIFCAKGHRFVTHNKKLLDADETIPRTRENLDNLGPKLKVMLWQLPATFEKNLPRLENFLEQLQTHWDSVRHSIELRHGSWMSDEVAQLLSAYDVAACQSDSPDFRLWDVVTTDFVYVRLHGHTRKYASSYSPRSLEEWARRLRQWRSEERDAFVFFDNTAEGAAPGDAQKLKELIHDHSEDG